MNKNRIMNGKFMNLQGTNYDISMHGQKKLNWTMWHKDIHAPSSTAVS